MTKLDKSYLIQNIGVFLLIMGYFGMPCSTFAAGAVLGFGALLYRWRILHIRPDILDISWWKPAGAMLFFVVCLYISSIHGTDAARSLEATQSQINWWRPCLFSALLFNPRKEYYMAVCGAFTVGLIYIGSGIINGIDPADHRAYGGFENPNPFAAYISMFLPWTILGFAKYVHNIYGKAIGILITIAGIGAVIMSGSRGAIIAIVLVFLLGLLLLKKSKKVLIAGLVAFLLAGGLTITYHIGFSRLIYAGNDATQSESVYQQNAGRLYVWEGAWNMIRDYPVYGVGLHNFNHNYKNHYMPEGATEPYLPHAHNTVLQRLAETGIVGSIGFWFLILYQIIYLFRNRKSGPHTNYVAVAALASIFLGLIHGMVDYFFGLALYDRVFWIQWAVAYCCCEYSKRKEISTAVCE